MFRLLIECILAGGGGGAGNVPLNALALGILRMKAKTFSRHKLIMTTTRFSTEVLNPLVKLLRQAGHNWNPAAVPPMEVAYSVVKIGGFSLREYEEPTVAEFGVRGLIDGKRKEISAQYQKQLMVQSKQLMAQHEGLFVNEQEAVSFLLGNMDIIKAVYEKNPVALVDLELAIHEMQQSISGLSSEIQSLDDLCLCYFLSSRATSDTPWTVDMLAGLGRGARKKLEAFMNAEVVKTGEPEPDEEGDAPDLGE